MADAANLKSVVREDVRVDSRFGTIIRSMVDRHSAIIWRPPGQERTPSSCFRCGEIIAAWKGTLLMSIPFTRNLALGIATGSATILVGIATEKWGAQMKASVFIVLWLIPIVGWSVWLFMLPPVRRRWYLLHTYPGMSLLYSWLAVQHWVQRVGQSRKGLPGSGARSPA